MSTQNAKYTHAVVKYRWGIVIAALVYTIVTVGGIGGLVMRSDYKAFIDPEYPGMIELETVEATFTENKNVFLIVVPENGDVFTKENLTAIQELTREAWLIPYASRASSVTNFQHTEADGDDLYVSDLVPEHEPISDIIVDRARKVARNENALNGFLVSYKQHVAAIDVNFQFQDGELLSREQAEVSAAVKNLVREFHVRYPQIDIKVAGSVVIDYASDEFSARVNSLQMPLMLAIMAVWLVILLRSFWGTFSTAVIVILTGLTTMGVFGHFRLEIDGVTAIAPIVIMTLAVADSVHVIAGMQNGMRNGLAKIEAIYYSLRLNFMPVFLTSLTTVLGVITFSFSDFPSLRKLGLIIALGVTIAFVLSVTLLPAILSLLPIRAPKLSGSEGKQRISHRYGNWVVRYHKNILAISVFFWLACAAMLPKLIIDESFDKLFAPSTPERQAIDFMIENLAGFESMDIAVFGNEEGSLNDPEFLAKMEEFRVWALAQPGVNHVNSITDTFKRLNKNMHGDDPAYYRLPEDQELAAQYLLLYEMSLPYGLDINNQIDQGKTGTRLNLILGGLTSGDVVGLQQNIREWFSENAPKLQVIPTGMLPLMSDMTYVHMIPNMMKGGIIAVLMVSLVLFLALHSWRLGLLGMLANIVPITMGFGLWAVYYGMANFAVMSVAGICLGVVVDFAVHFLNKYQKGYKENQQVEAGVRYAFEKVSFPLVTTMLVLVSGFWVLATSPFQLIGHLGLLAGIIILLALAVNLLFLPAVLLTFEKHVRAP